MNPIGTSTVDALLPSLGFFGANSSLSWRIPVHQPVTAVRLSLDTDVPTFLNLQRVEFIVAGNPWVPGDGDWQEQLSSVHAGADGKPSRLIFGEGVHSSSEVRPSWVGQLSNLIQVDEIRIANRRDTWGRRSQYLMVEVQAANGAWRVIRRNHGAESVADCFTEFARLGLLRVDRRLADPQMLRAAIVAGLARRLEDGHYSNPGDICWRMVMPLIPIWSKSPLTDDELTVCAGFLLDQLSVGDDFAMTYLSAPLYSAVQLGRITETINRIALRRGGQEYMLTRHGLQRQGKLITNREAFISAARRAVAVLSEADLKPALAYGTLLGAVRDGDFIAHDDDLDLLCHVDATDAASARAEMNRVIDVLAKGGFSARFSSTSALNVHAFDKSNGALIDVFPYWTADGRAYLHMARMSIRDMSAEILDGRSEVALCGRKFPAPMRAEDFLAERYGANWRVPMAHFEWPWPLADEAELCPRARR